MSIILAIANQKGGVGKTTTAINLAASLVQLEKRVLLVDLDPQGNATMGSGFDKQELLRTMNDWLLHEAELDDLLLAAPAGYDVLPTNSDLTIAEVQLLQEERRESRLRDLLDPLKESYDYIVIDCPPALSMLTVNGLVAATQVLVPVQCEYYALEGLTDLLQTIDKIQKTANPELKLAGVLRTMYDARNSLTIQVSEQLLAHFGKKVYETWVPRNVRLAEAPSFGMPILLYDKNSPGAAAYLELAWEITQAQLAAQAE